MKTLESTVAGYIKKTFYSEIGNLYCFNHIAIVEFKEGVHINVDTTTELLYELVAYFGTSRPFGLISNRTNSYSISLIDSNLIKTSLPNLSAYGVVGCNNASQMGASLENDFCKNQNIRYNSLYEAMDSVYSRVKEALELSLD